MIAAWDGLCMFVSQLVFFGVGWIFFGRRLFKDYEVRQPVVQWVFSGTFALSCSLFELIIFEILNVLHPESRWWLLKWHVIVLLVDVILLIPLLQLNSLLNFFFIQNRTRSWMWTVFAWCVYFYGFWKIGDPFPLSPSVSSAAEPDLDPTPIWLRMESYLSRVGVLGVTVMAFLSGFGAVHAPPVADEDVIWAERRLVQTMEIVWGKKKRLIVTDPQSQSFVNDRQEQGFVQSVFSSVLRPFQNWQAPDRDALKQEVEALETLCRQLFMELDDLNIEREKVKLSKTWKGRYWNVVGYAFSIYCVYKLIMSAINIILHREGKTDPVTYALGMLVHYARIDMDIQLWSQYLSFLTVGLMVVASIRGLLIQLTKIVRAFSTALPPTAIVLFLAQLMGTYFLSSFLLLRMSLPEVYRAVVSRVLGRMEFGFYHRWFDVIFLVSGLTTVVLLYAQRADPRSQLVTSAGGLPSSSNAAQSSTTGPKRKSSGFEAFGSPRMQASSSEMLRMVQQPQQTSIFSSKSRKNY